MVDVLLLVPPKVLNLEFDIIELSQNLSTWYLGSYLLNKGIHIELLDLPNICLNSMKGISETEIMIGYSENVLIEKIKTLKPKIIGITCSASTQHTCVVKMSQYLKSLFKEIVIVVGGNHATFMYRHLANDSCGAIDYIVLGEGEEPFTDLCTKILKEETDFKIVNVLKVDSINNDIRYKKRYIESNSLPLLNPHLYYNNIKMAEDIGNHHLIESTEIMFSRGCIYNCDFCTSSEMWNRKVRIMPEEKIEQQLRLLKEYEFKHLLIEDDDYTSLIKNIEVETLIKKYGFTWQNNGGLNMETLKENDVRIMANSKCSSVSAPINLRSERECILSERKKERVEYSFKLLNYYKIPSVSFLILGLPNQTKEEMYKQIEFAKHLKDRYNIKFFFLLAFSLLPGTLWKRKIDDLNKIETDYDETWWPGYSLYVPQLDTQYISRTELGYLIKDGMKYINNNDYDNFYKPIQAKNILNNK